MGIQQRCRLAPACHKQPDTSANNLKLALCTLQVRYRDDLELVLKGLSFTIDAGEKIGIVGRTGCGKSTLMNTLLRIVEPSGGQVVIDGVDLANVPLHELRSRIALVPQVRVVKQSINQLHLESLEPTRHQQTVRQIHQVKSCSGVNISCDKYDV